VGVEHHLLALARIGPDEHHPAVAEPDLRHLHRHGDTLYEHSSALQQELGYRPFMGAARAELERWLAGAALMTCDGTDLADAFMAALRDARVIAPSSSTFERLCAVALVEAERQVLRMLAGAVFRCQGGGLQTDCFGTLLSRKTPTDCVLCDNVDLEVFGTSRRSKFASRLPKQLQRATLCDRGAISCDKSATLCDIIAT
jgi:hypothetical protein